MSNVPLGLGTSQVSICPDFLICQESYGFSVAVKGLPGEHFASVDMADRAARFGLLKSIAEKFPDLASGDGLTALMRALRELAAGQPAAGPSVDECRSVIRSMAAAVKGAAR